MMLLLAFGLVAGACTTAPEATEAPPTEVMPEETMEPTEEPMAGIDCMGAQQGDEVSVLYQWSGAEEENFNRVVAPLVEACGIVIVPESSRDQALLDTRVQAGTPWDVVFWPTTGPVSQYADELVPLGDAGADASNYEDFWVSLGSSGGSWLAAPVKADIKSIIWYSPVAFEAAGYSIPTTFEDLHSLTDQMVADGNVPWSMGFESGDATGWTASDFIQDILLATQGPDYVLGIIDGSIPYDDAGVVEAYEIYTAWVTDPAYTVGGADGALSTGFLDAIYLPFADPPQAMMVKQSGFAGGEVKNQFPELEYGTDFDFFAFPGAQGMQGGADWMMVFNASPATQALVGFITSAAGGEHWASVGFDLTPNSAGVGNYTDEQLAKKADALASASGFTPDIGDSIPSGFGPAEWTAIVDAVSGASDIPTALAAAAAVQAEATAP
ncbi:MAG TPA: ABC transporter substrate-binding protein [Anaerolineales bacterium]|nr:ABC transporter substrate-binding protein [Anaerolineales bacterium]